MENKLYLSMDDFKETSFHPSFHSKQNQRCNLNAWNYNESSECFPSQAQTDFNAVTNIQSSQDCSRVIQNYTRCIPHIERNTENGMIVQTDQLPPPRPPRDFTTSHGVFENHHTIGQLQQTLNDPQDETKSSTWSGKHGGLHNDRVISSGHAGYATSAKTAARLPKSAEDEMKRARGVSLFPSSTQPLSPRNPIIPPNMLFKKQGTSFYDQQQSNMTPSSCQVADSHGTYNVVNDDNTTARPLEPIPGKGLVSVGASSLNFSSQVTPHHLGSNGSRSDSSSSSEGLATHSSPMKEQALNAFAEMKLKNAGAFKEKQHIFLSSVINEKAMPPITKAATPAPHSAPSQPHSAPSQPQNAPSQPHSAPSQPQNAPSQSHSAPPQPSSKNVEKQPWYRNVTRQDAMSAIKQDPQEGAFIVRPGRDTPYSLTVYSHNEMYNLQVRCRLDGNYALGTKKKDERSFPTVTDMVEYYMSCPVTLADGLGSVVLGMSPKLLPSATTPTKKN